MKKVVITLVLCVASQIAAMNTGDDKPSIKTVKNDTKAFENMLRNKACKMEYDATGVDCITLKALQNQGVNIYPVQDELLDGIIQGIKASTHQVVHKSGKNDLTYFLPLNNGSTIRGSYSKQLKFSVFQVFSNNGTEISPQILDPHAQITTALGKKFVDDHNAKLGKKSVNNNNNNEK